MKRETLIAPISGIIATLYVKNGDLVRENELILQIEVMKMFFDVISNISGKINLTVTSGQFVQELSEMGMILGD